MAVARPAVSGGPARNGVSLKRLIRFAPRLILMLAFCPLHAGMQAQTSAEVRYYNPHYGRYVSRYSNGTVTVQLSDTPQDFTRQGCATGDTVCGHWEGTSTANTSDLDLDGVEVQQGCCDAFGLTGSQGFGLFLPCKGGGNCVSQRGRFTGFDSERLNPNGMTGQLVVSCATRNECAEFLTALKGGSIAQGAKFAAFAQSGGFDANSGWGVATGMDLNSTIAMANTACVAKAKTTCDDQGYCMLRPGFWSAWASDLKYMGGKAFACNLKTGEDARNRALTMCGKGCTVLWTGMGQ